MIRKNLQQENKISVDTEDRNTCKSCGLCRNQHPIFDKQKMSSVVWVGLSAVKIQNDKYHYPLSRNTNTGSLINKIESLSKTKINFYKTNLVKCLPLSQNKIRYPSTSEMENCIPILSIELGLIKPQIVFLLGKQVSSFFLKKHNIKNFYLDTDYNYKPLIIQNLKFYPVHHPSFILVYKRKQIEKYVNSIADIIANSFNEMNPGPDFSFPFYLEILEKSDWLFKEKWTSKNSLISLQKSII